MSGAGISKLAGHRRIIAEHLGHRRFEALTEVDMKDLHEWVKARETEDGEPVSDATVRAYKQVIKRFWRWMHELPRGEHPRELDWINTGGTGRGHVKLPKTLLSCEDVKALKDACRNTRNRAITEILAEFDEPFIHVRS